MERERMEKLKKKKAEQEKAEKEKSDKVFLFCVSEVLFFVSYAFLCIAIIMFWLSIIFGLYLILLCGLICCGNGRNSPFYQYFST